MAVIFISGPSKSMDIFLRERIKTQPAMLALEVWSLGVACICPHTNSGFLFGELPEEIFLTGYLEILERCDALLLTENWQQSTRSRKERQRAIELQIPIFYNLRCLKAWLEGK